MFVTLTEDHKADDMWNEVSAHEFSVNEFSAADPSGRVV